MIAELTFGKAREVADYLNQANNVSVQDLTAALINAMERIHCLEKRCDALESRNMAGELLKNVGQ